MFEASEQDGDLGMDGFGAVSLCLKISVMMFGR